MRFVNDNDAMGFDSAIIVGGGIVGLAIAHELSASGRSVILLEKEPEFASPNRPKLRCDSCGTLLHPAVAQSRALHARQPEHG